MGAKRGPADPARRERIMAATERILLRGGIAALSHRAVAREAGGYHWARPPTTSPPWTTCSTRPSAG